MREALLQNIFFELRKGVYYQNDLKRPDPFESLYHDLRTKEHRAYTDEIVKNLPLIPLHHPLHHEWKVREASLRSLTHYLKRKKNIHKILEIGCGNGWVSNQLVSVLQANVCGLDLNEVELTQAARVFADDRLTFVYANVWDDILPHNFFDVIVLASSIQYFQDIKPLIQNLRKVLTPEGEIHIIDSPFYLSIEAAEAARMRSQSYFISLGFPEMAERYFHHTFASLTEWGGQPMNKPNALLSRIRRKLGSPLSPFPWIRVREI